MRFALRGTARAALMVIFGLVVAACETPPSQNNFAEITFSHLPEIKLNVSEIVYQSDYQAPKALPNVDHVFPVPPERAVKRWADDRLRAVGPANKAVFILKDASVIEERLETKGGVTGAFTTQQSERYTARMSVEMNIVDNFGNTLSTLNARTERSTTTAEDLSLREREEVWFKLTEDVMRDLDQQLEPTIRRVFFPYVTL
ncbi:hypothetical protein [Denitrobaculum tricleocarpae]|uniref:Uncharacterized protein n=1 Tax=Denitrobaculum tricleocarpae TaxID=2591009 RepID=A0A545T804_9PROT|nr:hypothetical protein [Denitrobaculum tricleocarpae]TQV73341.1 hypothetical protein FKG95_25330 [Denitrobaculum tricleocarpae]